MRQWGIPLHEVADLATHLPPEGAVRRQLDPHWQRTPELDLLRDLHYAVRVLVWQNAGGSTADRPQPVPLPWDPPPEGTIAGDVLPADEMASWLGWDKLEGTHGGS